MFVLESRCKRPGEAGSMFPVWTGSLPVSAPVLHLEPCTVELGGPVYMDWAYQTSTAQGIRHIQPRKGRF